MRPAVLLTLLPSLLSLVTTSSAAKQVRLGEGSVVSAVVNLKPGEFIWEPRLSPRGPLVMVVNASTQRALLFRNGVPVAATTVSTGRPGYRTPTGVFTVLEKRVEHYSSKYDNAPMPYMQRLTWGGIALHAGNLPGYPASHGCIRLPSDFARKLFVTTQVGMTVFIIDQPASPRIAPNALPVFGSNPAPPGKSQIEWHPERSPSGPLSILVSARDNKALVFRNGVVIGSSNVSVTGPVTSTFAYVLQSRKAGDWRWIRIDFNGSDDTSLVEPQEWRRFTAPSDFDSKVRDILEPGTTVVVTADSLEPTATSDRRILIESAQGSPG